MKRNYNSIASFYDQLAGLIYGRVLINAQLYLLQYIPAGSRILIAGGGTGRILEEIARIHPSGLTITYIDASSEMIARAEKRNAGGNKVSFIGLPVEDVVFEDHYDAVITPFLFDNFGDDNLQKMFAHIDAQLGLHSLWLYCDFRNTTVLWQKAVLKIMYVFFRLTCGVEASCLPDAETCFSRHHYTVIAQQNFLKGFIVSAIYKKG